MRDIMTSEPDIIGVQMALLPEIAARLPLVEGFSSVDEAYVGGRPHPLMEQFHAWNPAPSLPQVDVRDDAVPGRHGPVPVRVYSPPDTAASGRPLLVWCHGGGFVGGSLDMAEADWTAREVCHRAGAVVVSVDYRLARNGVHYPVPHDDVVDAVRWARDAAGALGADAGRVSVGGASAGGNLSAGAVLRVRDEDGWVPGVLLQVYSVLHPVVPVPDAGLAAALAALPSVFRPRAGDDHRLTTNYLGGPLSTADGYAMPALAQLAGLCPVVLLDAEHDHLRSSGQAFAAALASAGVDVRRTTVRGVLHGFLNQPSTLAPVDGALALVAEVVRGG